MSARINDAVSEALDAIGDDEEYAEARVELLAAQRALSNDTTAVVQLHLDRALELFNAACPL